MKTKSLIAIVLLAIAVGGTCPSDVNNDGSVGIQDFLQLLGEWGPCPDSQIVSSTVTNTTFVGSRAYRVWSDGRLDVWIFENQFFDCWNCSQSTPQMTWVSAGTAPGTAAPLDIDAVFDHIIIRLADGTIWTARSDYLLEPDSCPDKAIADRCFFSIGPWSELQ